MSSKIKAQFIAEKTYYAGIYKIASNVLPIPETRNFRFFAR